MVFGGEQRQNRSRGSPGFKNWDEERERERFLSTEWVPLLAGSSLFSFSLGQSKDYILNIL